LAEGLSVQKNILRAYPVIQAERPLKVDHPIVVKGGVSPSIGVARAVGNNTVNALRTGLVRGAGLDVFDEEPLPATHPLIGLENVILSPHAAALTWERARRMDEVATKNCLDAINGKLDPILIVPNEE
jgi:D-isomer specific 2-hydroxyacid dehydrogenase, NAD binding domain